MDEEQLEAIIAALVKRKQAADIDSAEYAMLQRCLNGLRYTYDLAGDIWEEIDTFGWGATPP